MMGVSFPGDQGRLRASVWVFCIAFAMHLGCSTSEGDDSAQLETKAAPVVGGFPTPTCGWPSVVFIGGECTGTLIHPEVVLTAAHCIELYDLDVVLFGESDRAPARSVATSFCTAHPGFDGGDVDDIGFCLLQEAVDDVPIVWPMAACEMSSLSIDAPVTEVGFGVSTAAEEGAGVKRALPAQVTDITASSQLLISSGTQDGEYYGDSGGPAFIQMADASWRVAAVDCCSPSISEGSNLPRVSTYAAVPPYLSWLEATSGFDLSPCHASDLWSPDSRCATFGVDPGEGSGG